LCALSRRNRKDREFYTVSNQHVQEHLEGGWEVYRQNNGTTRLSRPKRREVLLEDRVWSLLYAMRFTHLCGKGGGSLHTDSRSDGSAINRLNVIGLDSEIALAIECRSAAKPKKDGNFQDSIAKISAARAKFAGAANRCFPLEHKRVPVLAIFTWDLLLSDDDHKRAHDQKVGVFNEHDLAYYEQLVSNLGPAENINSSRTCYRGSAFMVSKLQDLCFSQSSGSEPATSYRLHQSTCLRSRTSRTEQRARPAT